MLILLTTFRNIKCETRHVFLKHRCPGRQQSKNMAKSLSLKF